MQSKRTPSQQLLMMQAEHLAKQISIEDIALMSPAHNPTQYTGKPTNSKTSRKGGSSPAEYSVVEAMEDLRSEIKKETPDWSHLARCYLFVSSMMRC